MSGPTFTPKTTQPAGLPLRKTDSTVSFEPLQPTAELLAELTDQSERLETATPAEILSWAVKRFSPFFSMA
ncbi:MAG TPA: phosphoadenylyl-sulfate reductase, partial [Planctomycetes bacterium]|nr:phosphoadenylyl-sulfate reductase [Planctomycetota bacterium]